MWGPWCPKRAHDHAGPGRNAATPTTPTPSKMQFKQGRPSHTRRAKPPPRAYRMTIVFFAVE